VSGLTRETALGFTIVWIAFGAGLIAIYLALIADRRPPRSLFVVVPAAATLAALFLPAIRGTEAAADRVVLTSWAGLDAISVATIVVLVIATAAWSSWACAASAVALLGGNLVIQSTTTRGTEVAWGLPVAFGCAIGLLAAAATMHRRGSARA
jgi:hypothetical protein